MTHFESQNSYNNGIKILMEFQELSKTFISIIGL